MHRPVFPIKMIILIIALFGCAGRQNVVVLLPNADGSVGEISISNSKGTTILDQAGEASSLKSDQAPPGEPFIMDETKISTIFGPALRAAPQPPEHFILYFEHNSTQLNKQSMALLDDIIETIKERRSVDTSIIGHADTAGDSQHNYELSKRRAVIVGKLLVDWGVDPRILEITSHGEKNLLIPTGDDVPEARNRRVNVTVR